MCAERGWGKGKGKGKEKKKPVHMSTLLHNDTFKADTPFKFNVLEMTEKERGGGKKREKKEKGGISSRYPIV